MTLDGKGGEINLNAQAETGKGVQVHAGMIGLGLPPVQGQWLEGAGDGATYRGGRTLARDLDLPLTILADSRRELVQQWDRLATMLSDECRLVLHDTYDNGEDWYLMVRRVGGGNFVAGHDTTSETELETVITVRAGDPYWTALRAKQAEVVSSPPRGVLTSSLATMRLAASQALGEITIDNSQGTAPAFPMWVVTGPGTNFRAVSPTGEVLAWNGTLAAGQRLSLDARFGRVYDIDTRENLYKFLAPAPKFWAVPPGTQKVVASIGSPGVGTKITCTWRPRKWAVI